MSGVYFANTKPILTCGGCPFNEWNPSAENCGFCSRLGRPVWDDDEPCADCEIVNVPDHGRLVDADAILQSIKTFRYGNGNGGEVYVNEAPTVIPAEKEGEA